MAGTSSSRHGTWTSASRPFRSRLEEPSSPARRFRTARDLDPAEGDALTASQLHRVPADPDAISAVVAGLGPRPVYLHVDVDIIDGPQLPGLRFPVDGGPAIARVEDCLAAIATAADVTAAGIACAWLPEHVNDQATREAIARLAGSLGARLAWQEASAV